MSVHATIAQTFTRIASATSVIRTREEDAAFLSRHEGRNGDLTVRAENVLTRLEQVAERLEKQAV